MTTELKTSSQQNVGTLWGSYSTGSYSTGLVCLPMVGSTINAFDENAHGDEISPIYVLGAVLALRYSKAVASYSFHYDAWQHVGVEEADDSPPLPFKVVAVPDDVQRRLSFLSTDEASVAYGVKATLLQRRSVFEFLESASRILGRSLDPWVNLDYNGNMTVELRRNPYSDIVIQVTPKLTWTIMRLDRISGVQSLKARKLPTAVSKFLSLYV